MSWTGSTSAGVVDSVRECGCIQVDSVSLSNRRTERRRSDYSFVDCPRTARAHAVVDTRHLRCTCTRRLVRYCLLWYCELDTSTVHAFSLVLVSTYCAFGLVLVTPTRRAR